MTFPLSISQPPPPPPTHTHGHMDTHLNEHVLCCVVVVVDLNLTEDATHGVHMEAVGEALLTRLTQVLQLVVLRSTGQSNHGGGLDGAGAGHEVGNHLGEHRVRPL